MKKVHVNIDGIDVFVPENYTILEAAKGGKYFNSHTMLLKGYK